MSPSDEHEFEAEQGLPEPLPQGEHVLWQGGPVFSSMVERVFHARTLAVYFAVILLARSVTVWVHNGTPVEGVEAALWLLPAALFALGIVVLLAWLTSKTTLYTITDRRVVMRVGIVLTVTFNLPFSRIEAAATSVGKGSTGDIALSLAGPDRIAYLHLWPHARPWRLKKTEPMLRSIADAPAVGRLLADAWGRARGIAIPDVATVPSRRREAGSVPASGPSRQPHGLTAATH